ncbi:signal recognition particle-docking protein FtsY [Calderihabitans maritimus]|uniref:Signal recognition particle receptor FtsY n=1 Tax=Calderihabitans maritimus TaxID=1246530 RepID=A0A1Z5HP21_9FIRM|nr:signal recognition particle-docking protein FtsY [Calderihabitans maritimus]GAW91045.1 signal recognition particle-docking protein FtsY [Calderihabitans maritimus]
MGLFSRLRDRLVKTRQGLVEKISELTRRTREIDEDFFEELEAILLGADVGVEATEELIDQLRAAVKEKKLHEPEQVQEILKEKMAILLGSEEQGLNIDQEPPNVVMVVGVNGVGKTTTIGKLAYQLKQQGRKVLLAAGDTFRAAAIDQLEVWAQRVGVEVIKHQEGADPAAVVYDALQAARARKTDVLIVDTAGRLHTKSNLMEELKKVRRIIEREHPGAPHEVLLVLDATTGQNALSQVKLFKEAVGVTGIVLTKLDGTAKGGVIIAISSQFNLPVKLIGIGEKLEDLRPFDPGEFVEALFAEEEKVGQ